MKTPNHNPAPNSESRPFASAPKALLLGLTALMTCLLAGCMSVEPERIVKLHDTEQSRPAANRTLLFIPNQESGVAANNAPRLGPDAQVVEVQLDANGEARIRLRKGSWWARLDEGQTTYGTAVEPSGLQSGGMFQLYARSRRPYDTNLYPSKFVLTITKP